MHLRTVSRHARAARAGFTLMELLVVVAILLVLAGTSILAYKTIFAESKGSIAKAQATHLAEALENYSMSPNSGGNYPDPSTGFADLILRGYLTKEPIDPWGQPYRWDLRQIGDGSQVKAVVWSCGVNRTDENGAGDDITSE